MGCCCGCGGGKWAWLAAVGAASAVAYMGVGGGVEPPKEAPPAKAPGNAQPGDAKPSTPGAPSAPKPDAPKPADKKKDGTSVYDFTMKRIDGTSEPLSTYKGKVILIVNVASQCGFTPQYEGLQKLYTDKKEAGLVILGFPANDFRGQEPGTNDEIQRFCSSKFGVTFPMFEKIVVSGPDAHPLYKFLAGQPGAAGGEPKWNFSKYLVDRTGKVVVHYESKVKPDDAELTKKIDELLKAKPEGGEAKKDEPKKGG
jgi:glutathione peroxidase